MSEAQDLPTEDFADDGPDEAPAKLPLDAWHRGKGARMVEFAGYEMPIQFEGIVAEHDWTREQASLFDVSHMGQLLVSGERAQRTYQLSCLLDGYEQMRDFDRRELALIEPLRTLRLIHYSAWLARRWDDPTFPLNFPWFGSSDYWKGQIQMLEDQLEAMQEEPLMV